ncbi:zf-HC2 domain-containing protein [Anatilimnocola floriformis]|uniref:zf-HC2 domain-containing protein n=1 Tax=Anatilimnocola floriformis TaxID=2948575 RepID=UPI0020C55D0F|nr:zf-HC2 domain-containing protein [Anatilimnocola floriformis]
MNCAEFQSQLQAWLAGETDETVSRALETHLNQCADCLALLERENAETQDLPLLKTALAEPQAAARVAERVMERLSTTTIAPAVAARTIAWSTWLTPLLTLVAGFLLALLVLPRPEKKNDPAPSIAQPIPAPAPVAHLVAATGTVEMFDQQQQNWVPISKNKINYFACPTDSRVRTTADVRCELQTGDGCVIRLNDQTEVTLRGSSSIELSQGQVWCRSPRETQLEVRVTNPANNQQKKSDLPTMWCVGPSCVMTGIQPAGEVQVVNAEGEINLRTTAGEQRLNPGQVAEISGGEIKPVRHVDPMLSTRWMQPLMMRRGPDDAELKHRVDALLAQIGQSKIATLYEQEIRSLGEYGVLPLVRFIQSPLGEKDPTRRSAAMEIVADLAPVWLIPDLIDLLENPDASVRRQAAVALHRLTALDMNLGPNAWQEKPNDDQAKALDEWRGWWAAHRDRYPKPQLQITAE